MTQSEHDAREGFTEQSLNDALGIVVTEEGKARGRRRLAEAEAAWTPERYARSRTRYGIRARSTAA